MGATPSPAPAPPSERSPAIKLTIDTDKLSDAAQWALRAIPDTTSTPAMAGIRLEAADNTLTLAGVDHHTDRSTRAVEDCVVAEAGTVLVPGRLLVDVVTTLPPGQPTTLAVDGTDLVLSCGTVRIALPTFALTDYPALLAVPDASGTVDGAALAEAAARVAAGARAVAPEGVDEKRSVSTGVEFTLSGTTMVLSATDGHVIHVANVPWTPNPAVKGEGLDMPRTQGSTILPAGVFRDGARVFADAEKVELAITGRHYAVSIPGRRATGPIIDGVLPDRPFPTTFTSVATTGTQDLTDAFKHIQPLLGERDLIVLDIAADHITVRAGSDHEGRSRDRIAAGLEGEPLTIAFRPELLVRAVRQISGPVTRINLTAALDPVLLHGVDQADVFRALVMPTRL
ncbi:DNA polymerase III subunit beta [Kitasatospora sp. LaBMicrA B282]|uniref:DNA polymerase III subunit beta n=1 Tax=Kitasatospora sp. LaBMicrA B282 TaxID=3420949 RepID=UPI003D10FAB6